MWNYLSRVHHDDLGSGEYEPEVRCELFSLSLEEEELSFATVMQEQPRDRALSQVIRYLEQGELPQDNEEARQVMLMSDYTAVCPPGVL